MESCPRVEIANFKELLKEENLYLHTEVFGFKLVLFGLFCGIWSWIRIVIWWLIGRRSGSVACVDFEFEREQGPEKTSCRFLTQYA